MIRHTFGQQIKVIFLAIAFVFFWGINQNIMAQQTGPYAKGSALLVNVKTPVFKIFLSGNTDRDTATSFAVKGLHQQGARLLTVIVERGKNEPFAIDASATLKVWLDDGSVITLINKSPVYATFNQTGYGYIASVNYGLKDADVRTLLSGAAVINIDFAYSGGSLSFELKPSQSKEVLKMVKMIR